MGWFDFLQPGGNPSDEANDYFNKIPGQIKPYYDPYIKQGRTAMDDLQSQYQSLIKDPGSILSRIGAGYKESPGLAFKRNQGLNSINNAAAAGGMAGTMQHQQQAGQLAEDLSEDDYNEYLKNALGLYGMGTKGEEGISERGFNASTGLADRLAQVLASQGGYAYEGAAAKNKQFSDLLGELIGGGASLLSRGNDGAFSGAKAFAGG